MKRPDAPYAFVPLTRGDLPLLRRWLVEPHVREWWGDPGAEVAEIAAQMEARLACGAAPCDMRLVQAGGVPFAYVQDYRLDTYDTPFAAQLPEGTRGIDTFIGDPAFLGQGHAAAYLRQRAGELLAAGAPCISVDPDPDNTRAIATYRRAGFTPRGRVTDAAGAPVHLMTFDRAAMADTQDGLSPAETQT